MIPEYMTTPFVMKGVFLYIVFWNDIITAHTTRKLNGFIQL